MGSGEDEEERFGWSEDLGVDEEEKVEYGVLGFPWGGMDIEVFSLS